MRRGVRGEQGLLGCLMLLPAAETSNNVSTEKASLDQPISRPSLTRVKSNVIAVVAMLVWAENGWRKNKSTFFFSRAVIKGRMGEQDYTWVTLFSFRVGVR